jgi:diguanylate cyclase (GGDEF)-like protein/PAS domain S-box-containing protein
VAYRSFGAVGSEQQILLPESAALVCEGGVVVQANLAAARLAGRRLPESLIGLSLPDLLVDAGTDAELIGSNGRATPVRVVRWSVPGAGQVVLFLVDVSDLRSASDALRTERRRLTEVERVAGIGSWEFDPATGSTQWSPGHYDILGVEPGTVVCGADAVLELAHPQDRDRLSDTWSEHLATGAPVDTHYRVLRPDGAVRVIRARAELQRDQQGRPIRQVGCIRDVTERRRVDSELAREHAQLMEAQRIARIGSFTWYWSTGELSYSPALGELFAEYCSDLADPFQLVHPADLPALLAQVQELVAAEEEGSEEAGTVRRECRGLPEYGETWYLWRLRVKRCEGGEAVRLLGSVQDITEQRATQTRATHTRVAQALEYQATHDELTGLPNRAAITDKLAEMLAAPDRDLAVLFCDVDNFTRVNDSLGHDAGDELLVVLADRLRDGLPQGCFAGRLSGDVYVVICSDVAAQGGISALVSTVAGVLRTVVSVHGRPVRVSSAIGVAVGDSSTAGPEDLLRFADAALFQAKRQSTGQVALANAALMASADLQVELECQLREALLHDALELHYQPVVGPDGAIHTAEALIRWPHPERGMLAPEVFLPVAEQGGLMRELDRWVLRTALQQARDWMTPDGRPVAVAVNLSGLVPGDPDFVGTVENAVAESGIPWDRVILELVETALMDLPDRTWEAMAELVERGVRFAVDDFGTGYSSLARLRELPAQIVKLDRRFVSGVGVDPSDVAVARAVVDMARAMGRCCVAEGVETATQFQVLRELGVDAYQGWLFSRPVTQREFRALLGLT